MAKRVSQRFDVAITSFAQKIKLRAVYYIRYEVLGDKAMSDIFVIQSECG